LVGYEPQDNAEDFWERKSWHKASSTLMTPEVLALPPATHLTRSLGQEPQSRCDAWGMWEKQRDGVDFLLPSQGKIIYRQSSPTPYSPTPDILLTPKAGISTQLST
jgi:hypothetical protein